MKARAFTLVELLVVIAIIGILASIIVVALSGNRASARDVKRVADLRSIPTVLSIQTYDTPLSGGGCSNGGLANACGLLSNYSDPSGTTACATSNQTSPCQYTIFGKGGGQPSTGTYEVCAYLESGVSSANLTSGLISISSLAPFVQQGCPNF